MLAIHPTAIIDTKAKLHDGVTVGPLCVVGRFVEIGPRSRLYSHVVLRGPTRLGLSNMVHPFAALGGDPQHRSYGGEATRLEIGDNNVIREHVTIHRGTVGGSGITIIGSRCLIMAGVHVAHDAVVGDNVTLTNGTLVGGHVQVGDWVVAAGHVAIAPFARIGESAFLAGNAMVERDIPPFVIAAGDRATVRAINQVGLRRRSVPEVSVSNLQAAFHILFPLHGPRIDLNGCEAEELCKDPFVKKLVEFLRAPSKNGVSTRHKHDPVTSFDTLS